MFSSSLPIVLRNTPITYPPKTTTTNHASSSSYYYYRCFQSHLFPSQPLTVTKSHSMTAVPSNPNVPVLENEAEAELIPEMIPRHVAVIMDGNRRWAKMRGLPSSEGHLACMKTLKKVVKLCLTSGVKILTAFAFSTENWVRSKVILFPISLITLFHFIKIILHEFSFVVVQEEVECLFNIFETTLNSEAEAITRYQFNI